MHLNSSELKKYSSELKKYSAEFKFNSSKCNPDETIHNI
jgi:hypothetical protein